MSWIMKGLSCSLLRYKRLSQRFHLMRNVSNHFEFNSFLKKNNVLINFCRFCSFLVDLLPNGIEEKSTFLFQKVPVNLLSINFV